MGALTAEQKELIEMTTRHKANNFLNEFRMEFQEHKTDVALMKQTIEFMQKDIGEIKQMTKDFISSADSKYATQEQHLQNKTDILEVKESNAENKKETEELKKYQWKMMGALAVIVPTAVYVLQKLYESLGK